MKIEISDNLYTRIQNYASLNGEAKVDKLIENLLDQSIEIVPTKKERKEYKEYLYNTLWFLATERPQFAPRKKDSLEELLESFFYWASEYNDGYFTERDDASTDKYCAWLVQEFEKY